MSAAEAAARGSECRSASSAAAGPEVSLVGLGANNFGGRIDLEASRLVVNKALDLGITLIDTADRLRQQAAARKKFWAKFSGRGARTSCWRPNSACRWTMPASLRGASRRYIMQAVEASLRRLKTDWIDLYQLHRPDPQTPIEETLRALDDLVKAGKVRFIGCSNFSAAQLEEAQACRSAAWLASFVTCQDEYNLLERDLEKDRVADHAQTRSRPVAVFSAGERIADRQIPAATRRCRPAPASPAARAAPTALLNARNWRIVDALAEFAAPARATRCLNSR